MNPPTPNSNCLPMHLHCLHFGRRAVAVEVAVVVAEAVVVVALDCGNNFVDMLTVCQNFDLHSFDYIAVAVVAESTDWYC